MADDAIDFWFSTGSTYPYEAATAEARRLGVFGSPSFAVRGEVFWGDDRLDDAIAWFRHGRLTP